MASIEFTPSNRRDRSRVAVGLMAALALVVALAIGVPAHALAGRQSATFGSTCPPYVLKAPPVTGPRKVIGIDVSASTRGGQLASLYEAAADGAIDQAAQNHEAVILIAFSSASSSSQLVFVDTFAGSTGNDTLDLANANRVHCQAYRAVAQLLDRKRSAASTGTDVGGNLAQLIGYARPAATLGQPASVLALTDGLTEPSPSGGAHDLIDLRRLIDSGRAVKSIYKRFKPAFALGNATGVSVTIKGLDREQNGALSSTARAQALTALWTQACKDAHAASCTITEEVP
jgi:hypothetical protein